MTQSRFQEIFEKQKKLCEDTLNKKKDEYAINESDRLGMFRTAAKLQNCTPREALAGMLAKHIVSVYEMCRSRADVSVQVWEEKITDSINYLFLLRALIEEENEKN